MQIRKVATADDAAIARMLVREYMLSWGMDEVTDADLLDELDQLDRLYGPPSGCILYAERDSEPLAVVALKGVDTETCEMKRMYVRPAARRSGIGRSLALALVREAATIGYKFMRLDTPSDNGPALAMYRSLGFVDIPLYFEVPPDHPIQQWTCLSIDLIGER